MFRKRKTKGKKYLQKVMQIGNFIIKKLGDGEHSYIRIGTIDGGWRMDFRDDTLKYAWILLLVSDEKYRMALEAWLVMAYHVANCNPDKEFVDNTLKELFALGERAQLHSESDKSDVTDIADQD